MIILKPGVRIIGLRPETLLAIMVVEGIFRERHKPLVLTAVVDGSHSRGSLHYCGCAFDARTRDLPPGEAEEVANLARSALGSDFDAVLESDHLHFEYQPKDPY